MVAMQRDLGESFDRCPADSDVQDLLATQVNDLVKYQVVRLLHQHPDVVGDAALFAAALGFHSAEYTRASLEELADSGVLQREICQANGQTIYFFANDPATRERITKLCSLGPNSPEYCQMLRLLAGRSLRLAQRRAKRKRQSVC